MLRGDGYRAKKKQEHAVSSLEEDRLRLRPVVRQGLLAGSMLFLTWLAWQALAGGLRQLSRSRTVGQKVETVIQLECGFLSLLVMLTSFGWRRWASPIRTLWSLCLATAAGLSAPVWGPPMPLLAFLFAAISLLVARAVNWALRTATMD